MGKDLLMKGNNASLKYANKETVTIWFEELT